MADYSFSIKPSAVKEIHHQDLVEELLSGAQLGEDLIRRVALAFQWAGPEKIRLVGKFS
ncbi:hypothetical protein VB738_06655 [Cyanobium gracile UHCC 0139]|uniref:Uncharacterized protein n=1 Tax=Cyanobium gracile UHCC 0139 TaxID=3110308 RepID=A0ABU5RT48_9CYAN|nr:hypothetical protein [Cyanobium gracile]MEA5390939.1 hypothetical protein [Cyanobium gracile UHCC 0139]